jgi:ATP-dependent Zn protease
MGGRVAEEIFFGKKYVTTGCSDDMNKATQLAYYHVRGGMFDELTGYSNLNSIDFREGPAMKTLVDESVNKILDESYKRVRALLVEHKGVIEAIADELVTKETLTKDEIL